MKKLKGLLMMAVLCLTLGFGLTMPDTQVQAASPSNVMKAPKAKAGQWVIKSRGYQYRFKKSGNYAKNTWLKIDGSVYYFKKNGYLQTGWKSYRGKRYYFNKQGELQTGWKRINGRKYYFQKSTGAAVTGKKKIASEYYYFSNKGIMQTGPKKIGKYYYYFKPKNGSMAVNEKIGKFYYNKYGRRTSAVEGVSKDEVEKNGSVDIFVGDSRTVGMGAVTGVSNKCIAKVGEGYDWYVSCAERKLKHKLKRNPNATVVINLGVNDITNHQNYIEQYRELINEFPDAKIYFMSVNPVDSKYGTRWTTYTQMKSYIKKFNRELKKAFPTRYIDCYTYLTKSKFSTVDGLHYEPATYQKIYEYILKQV